MKVSVLTDIGQKRSSNQDYVNKFDNKAGLTLIVLADGMGGHKAGNIASELTVTSLGSGWVDTDYSDVHSIQEWLKINIERISQHIYDMGQTEEYRDMGTTIEAAVVIGDVLVYAHVGDSRVGLIRDGQYVQLTSDHSLVNALVKAGQLTLEEAENHPQKNIITQSVGQANPLEIDLAVTPLFEGDTIVINSDGLTNMISNQAIIETVANQDLALKEKAKSLIDQANQAGGSDNITVALIDIEREGS